jgi:hypothetical protein
MRNFERWIEIVGVISLVVGIGLVFMQMRQNEELLRFQIATDLRVNRDHDRMTLRGEDYSVTLAKLQKDPADLTDEELVRFDAHVWSLVQELDLRRQLADEDIFVGDWRLWLEDERCLLLNNPIGGVWLETQRKKVEADYHGAMDEELLRAIEEHLAHCPDQQTFLEAVRDARID